MKIDKKLAAAVTQELQQEQWYIDMDEEGKTLAFDNEYARRIPISDYLYALYLICLNHYGKSSEFEAIIAESADPKLKYDRQYQRRFLVDFLQPYLFRKVARAA